MNEPRNSGETIAESRMHRTAARYGKEFWTRENLKFSEPWYRLEKSARLIRDLTQGRECTLLDLGCGPATLMRILPSNVQYFGMDIAIHEPGPNLIEADLREAPIRFENQRFDIVVAQGLFEYLGDAQSRKFAEIAELLKPDGYFLVSYTNFAHRKAYIYEAFSNVQSLEAFRSSLGEEFAIDRIIPGSHNWKHQQPNRGWLRRLNMHLNRSVPWVSRKLAVDYFFVCRSRPDRRLSTLGDQ